jgi:hypothetical protein
VEVAINSCCTFGRSLYSCAGTLFQVLFLSEHRILSANDQGNFILWNVRSARPVVCGRFDVNVPSRRRQLLRNIDSRKVATAATRGLEAIAQGLGAGKERSHHHHANTDYHEVSSELGMLEAYLPRPSCVQLQSAGTGSGAHASLVYASGSRIGSLSEDALLRAHVVRGSTAELTPLRGQEPQGVSRAEDIVCMYPMPNLGLVAVGGANGALRICK